MSYLVVVLLLVSAGSLTHAEENPWMSTNKRCKEHLPSLFEDGQPFPYGTTPLTMVRDGMKRPPVPDDWNGGYGWGFVQYRPSEFESDWAKEAAPIEMQAGTPLCDLLDNKFGDEKEVYFRELPRMTPHPSTEAKCTKRPEINDEPLKFNRSVFSSFEYEYRCLDPPCRDGPPAGAPAVGAKQHVFIEPLVGILRHPKACRTDDFEMIVNKNYMIVDPWAMANGGRSEIAPPPRVYYFDAGASTWEAGPGGASQGWFYRVYESLCFPFSDFFMWEASPTDPREVFVRIPGHLRPRYRWFNIPLTTDAATWDNPMNHLLARAKKEDVVIFKIDFDTPIVEHALIDQILAYPEVSELIDELYFEHHVDMEIMRGYWGTNGTNITHLDSVRMFTALRERGIRAHSWV